MQGDGFASELGGIMEVAMWLCAPLSIGLWSSLGLVPNCVVPVLGNEGENEGGGPHHIQGRHTHGLYIGLKKLKVLTLNIHQISNWGFKKKNFFIPMDKTKANMNMLSF
jgi:hypothetical protein